MVLTLLALTLSAQASDTLYVDDDGRYDATGYDPNDPVSSLSKAVSRAHSGDTVLVAAGTYDGDLDVMSDIDIVGVGDRTVLVVHQGLESRANLRLADLKITGPSFTVGVTVMTQSLNLEDVTFEGLDIGVYMYGWGQLTVDQCNFDDVKWGVKVPARDVTGREVTIRDSSFDVSMAYADAGWTGVDLVFARNDVHASDEGIRLDTPGRKVVKRNHFTGPNLGVHVEQADALVYSNVIETRYGIELSGGSSTVAHNTILDADLGIVCELDGFVDTSWVVNNAVLDGWTGFYAWDACDIRLERNLFSGNETNIHGDVDDVGDNIHASGVTLSTSFAPTGWRSPLIDAAIPLSTARRDLYGWKRGSAPEIGAVEYRRRY